MKTAHDYYKVGGPCVYNGVLYIVLEIGPPDVNGNCILALGRAILQGE